MKIKFAEIYWDTERREAVTELTRGGVDADTFTRSLCLQSAIELLGARALMADRALASQQGPSDGPPTADQRADSSRETSRSI